MTVVKSTLSDLAREVTEEALQDTLVDLLALWSCSSTSRPNSKKKQSWMFQAEDWPVRG